MGYPARATPARNITETDEGIEEIPAAFGELIYKATVTVEYALDSK